jgi:hypothetical protein
MVYISKPKIVSGEWGVGNSGPPLGIRGNGEWGSLFITYTGALYIGKVIVNSVPWPGVEFTSILP